MKTPDYKRPRESIQEDDARGESDRDSSTAPTALDDAEVEIPDRSGFATIPTAPPTSPTPRLPEILSALGGMNRALASSTELPQVIEIRNKAEALEHIVNVLEDSAQLQAMAATLRLRAERRAGAMLASRDKHPGGRPKSNLSQEGAGYPLTLTQLGIRRSTASRWQQVAAIPEQQFESYLKKREATKNPPTTTGLLSYVSNEPPVADYDRELSRLVAAAQRMGARWPDRHDQIAAALQAFAVEITAERLPAEPPSPANGCDSEI